MKVRARAARRQRPVNPLSWGSRADVYCSLSFRVARPGGLQLDELLRR